MPNDSQRHMPRWLARHIEGRPVVSAIARNASWLVSERLLQMAIGFVVSAWFVRYLGPSEYGRYSYALSFTALFSSAAGLGMDTVIVRELAREGAVHGEILGTSLALRLLTGLAAWLAACGGVVFVRSDLSTRLLVIVLGANCVFLGSGVFELWFQAHVASKGVVIVRTAANLFAQGLRCMFIVAAGPVILFAGLVPLGSALTVAGTYWLFTRSKVPGVHLRWSTARAKALLRDSVPMLATSICIMVYLKVDQVMIASICGDRENGIYAPAAGLSELFSFVPLAMSSSAFPVIVRALDKLSPAEYEPRLQSFYDGMAAAGYLFVVSLMLTATPLVLLLYGPAYERSAAVLRIHAVSFLFTTMGVARGRYLVARNHLGFIFAASLAGAIANVLLNLLLLPRLGAIGAAWATVLSYAMANYFSGFLWRPVWRQTALVSRAFAVPVRALVGVATRALRPGPST